MPTLIDYIVRGEGEATFRELVECLLKQAKSPKGILGLSYHEGEKMVHNPARPLLNVEEIQMPNRDARLHHQGLLQP